jgi:hypothetical protein
MLDNMDITNRLARSCLLVVAIGIVVLFFAYFASKFAFSQGIIPADLTQDPNSFSGEPIYIGSITFLFIILWSASASVSYMGAVLVSRKSRDFWFLLTAGLFTTMLGIDEIFPYHLLIIADHPQLSEDITFSVYALIALVFILFFLKEILKRTDFPILSAALLCLAASILNDVILPDIFTSDMLKLLGIALWLAYFSRTAVSMVREDLLPVKSG